MFNDPTKKMETSEVVWITRIKSSYRTFVDYTSIHGFTELYHSKSLLWKLFWLICLCGAFGIAIYQVNEATNQYFEQRSTTLIQPAKSDQIIYPPIKLCYTHWLYWVDFEKGYTMNFTKESILYALSYLEVLITSHPFNVTRAELYFNDSMAKNNMTTASEFFKAIAKHAPIVTVEDEVFGLNYSSTGGAYFAKTEIVTYPVNHIMNMILFCYIEDGDKIMKHIQKKLSTNNVKSNMNIFNFEIVDPSRSSVPPEITDEEYNVHMALWIEKNTPSYNLFDQDVFNSTNYPSFSSPMIVFPDGYSKVGTYLTRDIDQYTFTIKSSVHKWKNTKDNPCNISLRSVISDLSCFDIACAKIMKYDNTNESFFFKLHAIGEDKPANLLHYQIAFLHGPVASRSYSPNGTDTTPVSTKLTLTLNTVSNHFVTLNAESNTNPTLILNTESTTNPTTFLYTEPNTKPTVYVDNASNPIVFAKPSNGKAPNCSDICLIGCEKWNFDVSVSTSSLYTTTIKVADKLTTSLKIIYPLNGDVLMMTEVDSQTWESWIGNVGGVLGIWTGASIVSLVQMFYLLCCAECACCEKFPTVKRQRNCNVIHLKQQKNEEYLKNY